MQNDIKITNISIEPIGDGKKIRIDFSYHGQEIKIATVKIKEEFFKLGYRAIGGEIALVNGMNYWVVDGFNKGLYYRFSDKIKITVEDFENDNDILYSDIINIGNQNLRMRSQGRELHLRNIWYIGDSNAHHYFSKYPYGSDEFLFDDKILNPIDVSELTINRFVNSSYKKFIDSLPLMKGDYVVLNLGEIDCRVSLYRNARLKGLELTKHIDNVLDRYVFAINDLSLSFPEIEIVTVLPHPTLRDGWMADHDVDYYLKDSNEKERLFIHKYLCKGLTDRLEKINKKVVNPLVILNDEEGYIDSKFLIPKDTHTKDNDVILEEIKKIMKDL